jgi:hypothetical protein
LYKSRGSLAELELGVLAAAQAADGDFPHDWRAAWQRWAPESLATLEAIPWYAGFHCPLPVAADPLRVCDCGKFLADGIDQAGFTLATLRAVALFPPTFNQRLVACGSKGTLLTEATFLLIQELLAQRADDAAFVFCDKHGGRSKYGPLLQRTFPETRVEVLEESRARSVYRWGPVNRRVETRFSAKGDRFLPSALASMVAKYLRELAMQAFNAYWQQQLPGLQPTAGYPVDARRFRRAIQARMRQLNIPLATLWRER